MKVVFGFAVGVVGVGGLVDAQEVPDTIDGSELDDMAWEIACQSAESDGYYNRGDYEYLSEEELEGIDLDDDCYTEIEAWWEEYDPKKHDMKKPGGGKWFD